MAKDIKSRLLSQCIEFLDEKHLTLRSEYKLYQESAANETKSTAGDKHDTSKSMMQLEQEKLGQQLNMILQQKKTMESIDLNRIFNRIEFGCIAETSQGNFFIAIPLKEFSIDNKLFVTLSMKSPLGAALSGRKPGDNVEFNNKLYNIVKIY